VFLFGGFAEPKALGVDQSAKGAQGKLREADRLHKWVRGFDGFPDKDYDP
jgi:hypothetical protein